MAIVEAMALGTQRLFVYGTLAPGRPNAHVLADVPGIWEAASVRGRLLAQGWGAAAGYPGLVLDASGPQVPGVLFSSPELSDQWTRLDDFEGPGYRRVATTVLLADGRTTTAQVYTVAAPSNP